jgi:hypothetical protein
MKERPELMPVEINAGLKTWEVTPNRNLRLWAFPVIGGSQNRSYGASIRTAGPNQSL